MTSVFARTSPQVPSPFKGKSRWSDHRNPVRVTMQYRTSVGGLNPVWKAGRMRGLSVGGILIDIPEALPVSSTVELVMDCTGLYHGKPMVHVVHDRVGPAERRPGRRIAHPHPRVPRCPHVRNAFAANGKNTGSSVVPALAHNHAIACDPR
jgi:hypothetical protein